MPNGPDLCRIVNVDGEPIVVRGRGEPTPADLDALAELTRAVRAKADEADAADRAAGRPTAAERQQTALGRIRELHLERTSTD